ncbi:DHHC palmitoyltransferase-domain-containing protein [Kockovaella imperatae]|uniref:Palmitoyltransferase n=1 Tax=Kockovaella imperatae TaxID=4999 RepID=A0A1Y1UTE0_9TREE|nr:DHHC palmitoyltransferase-domain-containing protein [Kockovaella imperatae]ORX41281.1 DHHC palmitoyltransferase-domain-containing protein [Kockovaella imperatae]
MRLLLSHRAEDNPISSSPHFAAIITASLVWVFYAWATRLLRGTPGHAFTNLAFLVCALLCSASFYKAIRTDPGFVPKPSGGSDVKMMLEDLVDAGRLNGTNFCISCMTKKPLRSKHCRVCKRCTARYDHHCPWIWNCVGFRNHRYFLSFVLFLIAGIILFDRLTIDYVLENAPAYSPSPSPGLTVCDLSETLCRAGSYDAFLSAVAFWATLQLTWTLILGVSQLWQVSRQMTTLEVSNLGRYGYMGGRGGQSLRDQSGAMRQAAAVGAGVGPMGASENAPPESGIAGPDGNLIAARGPAKHSHGPHGHAHSHGSFPVRCCGALWKGISGPMMQVLGLDRFTKGKALGGMRKAGRDQNPFDMGIIQNCSDFWLHPNDIDYTQVYEIPAEGWKSYRRRAKMSTGVGAKGAYEPVSGEEV